MSTGTNDIGVIGLAVMGRNLVLNMVDHGFTVAAYNRTSLVTREFTAGPAPGQRVQPCYSLEDFAGSLAKPRRILMMVKAGSAVDAVMDSLQELLEPGDVLMDGGNSYFRDTERRAASLSAAGIHYMGVGISGGEYGARNGPSLMPGGPSEAYELARPVLEAIAARVDGDACVSYLGRGAAGHYVKMVHNGIEYGLMQLIAESYALMKQSLGLGNDELASVYAAWNEVELESYLVEITSGIFRRRDTMSEGHLIDVILGEAGQLGTGVWTSQNAMELHVPVPNIDVAVAMRSLSALAYERGGVRHVGTAGAGNASGAARAGSGDPPAARRLTTENVRNALYAAMVLTYTQGFALLHAASGALGYDLELEKVASIWRGGCIIRARLLRDIRAAFARQSLQPNLLLDERLAQSVATRREDLARVIEAGAAAGVPVPGFMAALAYLDAYRAEWLPFNLIQAQRDYFGAHEYRRTDRDGVFHTDWLAEDEPREPERS